MSDGETQEAAIRVCDSGSSRRTRSIYLVWGSTFLAIRIGVRNLPPLLFAGGRFLLAGRSC